MLNDVELRMGVFLIFMKSKAAFLDWVASDWDWNWIRWRGSLSVALGVMGLLFDFTL